MSLERNPQVIREGELTFKVRREVVSHLSWRLYRNFARGVKELISNSYDNLAKEVKIKLDLDNSRILVRDNGRGMNLQELSKFLTIGEVTPPTDAVDSLGRKRIGTFGIGCLSVFPYCDLLQIATKRKGKKEIIELDIHTNRFFRGSTFYIEEEKIPYKVHKSDLPKEEGETIVILRELKPHIIKELRQKTTGRVSIDKLGGFENFKWTLSQYIPIQFSPERNDLRDFFAIPDRTPMRVWLDGEELFRSVPKNAKVLEKGTEVFGDILIKYVIMSPMEPVRPEESRGLQVRLRDVAIGLPRDFDVTKLTGKVLGKMNYLCGEIHILKGLDSALMIDRDSFSFTEDVAKIYEYFGKKLIEWNNNLEKMAKEDKKIYEAMKDLEKSPEIVDELKKSDIVHLAKERLRIPKKSITKRKGDKLLPPSKKIKEVLSKRKDFKFKVQLEKGIKFPKDEPPIKIDSSKKTILIYEDHPDFTETLEIGKKLFQVRYDKWDFRKFPFICKLENDKTVIFNTSDPLFQSRLSNEVIKKLSLGVLIILKNRKDKWKLLKQIERLLTDVFLE